MPDLRSQLRTYYQSVIWLRDPGDVIAGRTEGVIVTQGPEAFQTRRWWSQPAVVATAVALLALVMFGAGMLLGLHLEGGNDVAGQSTTTATTTTSTSTTTMPGIVVTPVNTDAPIRSSRDLVAVSAREVWAVTAGMMGRFEDGDWTLWRLEGPGPTGQMNGLAMAPDGTVWVASDSGVFSFDGEEWTRRYDGSAGTVGVSVDGTVWIGGTPGWLLWLARWDGESWVRVEEAGPATSGSSPASPLSMTVLPDGEVWLRASMFMWGGDHVVRYDGTTMERVDISRFIDPGPNVSLEMAAASNGDLLVGGFVDNLDRQYRVARFDGDQWTEWAAHDWPSAEGAGASDMAVGPDDVLWFAFEGGLASVEGTEWTTRIAGPGVSAVDVAPDGTIWYADDQGVHIFSTP